MKKMMYALFDSVGEAYGQPMFVPNVAVLMRSLTDEMSNKAPTAALFVSHPADFCLYELGSFDDETCKFELTVPPRKILELVTLVEPVA